MNQRKIEDEAEFYSTYLDFSDDKNLNEKRVLFSTCIFKDTIWK